VKVILLKDEHAPLLYGFMVKNSVRATVAHFRRDVDIFTDEELRYFFLNTMIAIGVLGDDGFLVQVFLGAAEHSNDLVVRFIYGDFSSKSAEALSLLESICNIRWPEIYNFNLVVESTLKKDLFNAWKNSSFGPRTTKISWSHCSALQRPRDPNLSELVLHYGIPLVDVDVLHATVQQYTVHDLL